MIKQNLRRSNGRKVRSNKGKSRGKSRGKYRTIKRSKKEMNKHMLGGSFLGNSSKEFIGNTIKGMNNSSLVELANRSRAPLIAPQVDTIYFYDNDLGYKHNAELCPRIKFNWVNATGNMWGCSNTRISRAELVDRGRCGVGDGHATVSWRSLLRGVGPRPIKEMDDACMKLFTADSPAMALAKWVVKHVECSAYDKNAGTHVIERSFDDPEKMGRMESFYTHVASAAKKNDQPSLWLCL